MRLHLRQNVFSFIGATTMLCLTVGSRADSILGKNDIVSTPNFNLPNSIDINSFLGADTFYNAGYTGTRATVSNIEAGYIWNLHDGLTNVTTFLQSNDPSFAGTQLGSYDQHATWVGQAIAGQGTQDYQKGIAYNATLWSGAIAYSWVAPSNPADYSTNFNFNGTSFIAPYLASMQTGVSGKTADVINSSWSFNNTDGSSPLTMSVDALVNATHKIVVSSVGNQGNFNQVQGLAAGYNAIAVGATFNDGSGSPYQSLAPFSNNGFNDYSGPDGSLFTDNFSTGRALVDLLAPGTDTQLATYGGVSGGNFNTDPTGGATNQYANSLPGTSIASAFVSGGASLLVDAGYSQFGGGNAIDNRVIKAVLMASATQLPYWYCGYTQDPVTGVYSVNNGGMDFYQGAGQMNLDTAYQVYLQGTTGIAGGKGGYAGATGWDLGTVSTDTTDGINFNVYDLGELGANNVFTTVLTWNVDRSYLGLDTNGNPITTDNEFANLDLLLFEMVNGSWTEIAESLSTYNNTIELSFGLTQDAYYELIVRYSGERYDTLATPPSGITYGLAWNTSVPEPNSCALYATTSLFAITFAIRRRRSR